MATICTDAVRRPPAFTWPLQMLIALIATATLVTVSYVFIDEPVIAYFRNLQLDRSRLLRLLTRPPETFVLLSPLVVFAGVVKRWFAPWTWLEKVAVAAATSTLLGALAVLVLKITFGRAADGFHLFQLDSAYWAFPSGHTACTLSATAVVGAAFPSWRSCCWSLAGIVGALLIALSFHFVGDIVGGVFVGWAVGGTVARSFGVDQHARTR